MRLPSLFFAFATALLSISWPAEGVLGVPTPSMTAAPNSPSHQEVLDKERQRILEMSKYFHEPGDDDVMHHYDSRYFKYVLPFDQREATLQHMIRAYLHTFRQLDIETWIAHGTLLGWWWNGKVLPWDWDLDVQVSHQTIFHLGQHFNQTIHRFESTDGRRSGTYLLDVNPHYTQRERGDGMNIIDARWIDTRTGLFIDITALTETHPDVAPNTWSCKNYHHYRKEDLYPLRESTFEGAMVWVPNAFDRILTEEYERKSLYVTQYENHQWDPKQKQWIYMPEEGEQDFRSDAGKLSRRSLAIEGPDLATTIMPGLGNLRRLIYGS